MTKDYAWHYTCIAYNIMSYYFSGYLSTLHLGKALLPWFELAAVGNRDILVLKYSTVDEEKRKRLS